MNNKYLFLTTLAIFAAMALAAYALPDPDGALVTAGTPVRGPNITPGNVTAQGGNITQVNLTARTITRNWQGFYGNVTGNITLEDNVQNRLYAWSILNVTGEVYASRNSTINWATVSGVTNCTTDETITGTGTDRVNRTFTNGTVSFTIGSTTVTEACNTFTFIGNASQSLRYQEIIANATGVTSIYVTKINQSTTGFNGGTLDYQMIVPANQTVLTYYFFVELD